MKHLLCIVSMCVAVACNDAGTQSPGDTFDRKAMLTLVADSMIVPSYASFMNSVRECERACDAVADSSTVGSTTRVGEVVSARYAWSQLRYSWSYVQQFDFGPAESSTGNLGISLGSFPVNAAKLESYIAANDTSFANYDRDTRGIYAVEYLLFGASGNSADEVAAMFAANPARGAYLSAVVRDIKNRIAPVLESWADAYRDTFISNNGTAVGSSTSLLFNEFAKSYENIKNFKWSVPLGLRPGQAGPEPTKVECYYASQLTGWEHKSLDGTRAHFNAIVKTWTYFKPYLAVVPGGPELITQTQSQIDVVSQLLAAFPESTSLADQVVRSPAAATQVYTELQKLTRFFKSEMSSRLGIAITYSSGDGD